MSRTLFLDCDGVLADFDRHVLDLFGFSTESVSDDALWGAINPHPNFWTTIPVKPGARDLWAAAEPFAPVILTGCPRTDFDRSAAHKRQWIAQHFGAHVPVITCRSRDKPLYMRSVGDVLVDDRIYIIKKWRAAGGTGILYRDTAPAIREMLHALGASAAAA